MAGSRQLATTITNHLRTLEVATLRDQKIGAMLDSRGRISFDNEGNDFDWNVQYKNHPMTGSTGETPRNFTPRHIYKRATLGWRGYQMTDAISKDEKLANRGQAALVKVYSKMVSRMQTSFKQGLGAQYYIDGSATGNELFFHGFNAMVGTPTQTVSVATGLGRTFNAADPAIFPIVTDYAGISTVLGAYGGSDSGTTNATVWPFGEVLPEYDFYTPLGVNYLSTFFGGVAATWKEQCIEALRFAIGNLGRNEMGSKPDMCLMSRNMYQDAQNRLDAKERAIVTAENGLKSFGFKDVFEIDGCECSTEYNVPTRTVAPLGGTFWIFSIENMELLSRQEGLTSVEGPEYDINTAHDKYVVDVLGNMKFDSPRNFAYGMAAA